MSSKALLPCPFCGTSHKVNVIERTYNSGKRFAVACDNCGATVEGVRGENYPDRGDISAPGFPIMANAITAWNRRPNGRKARTLTIEGDGNA